MYEVPAGMAIADYRRHPIRQLLVDAAYIGGGPIPTKTELDVLACLPRCGRASRRAARSCLRP